jgi:hypothetical protein
MTFLTRHCEAEGRGSPACVSMFGGYSFYRWIATRLTPLAMTAEKALFP